MRFFAFSLGALSLIAVSIGCKSNEVTVDPEPVSLDSLLIKYPDSVELLLKRGEEQLAEYNYEQVMADAAKAFRLDSNNLDVRLLYADALNNRQNRSIEDIFNAQRHYKILFNKRPKSPKVLIGLASTYSELQDFDNSFKYINEALRVDPKYRDAYVLKGSNYAAMDNRTLMKSSYETAIQQDPEFFEGYLMLGSIYQSENNPVCIEYFTTANNLRPDLIETTYSMAYAKQHFGQVEEAQTIYRKMAQDSSDYYASQALFQLGHIKHFVDGDLDSAIYLYGSATLVEPRFVEAYHNIGVCWDLKGDKSKALFSFGKALKYNPEFTLSREYADSIR